MVAVRKNSSVLWKTFPTSDKLSPKTINSLYGAASAEAEQTSATRALFNAVRITITKVPKSGVVKWKKLLSA